MEVQISNDILKYNQIGQLVLSCSLDLAAIFP
jgi:hypothetical protein